MENKKDPRKDINRLNGLWFNAGLFIALCIVIMAFEWKSYDKIVIIDPKTTGPVDDWQPPVTIPDIPKPRPKPVLPNPIEIKEDDPIDELPEFQLDPEFYEIDEPIIADEPKPEVAEEVFLPGTTEVSASPEGGYEAFYKFISKNIKYPSKAKKIGVEGKVFAQFVVDKEGNITDVKIIRGIGAGCDEEVIRLMQMAPKWNPGKQRGNPVKVRMVIPIHFQLTN